MSDLVKAVDTELVPWHFKRWGSGTVMFEPVIILKPDVIELGDHCRVDSFVKLEGGQGLTIGRGVHVSSFCHLNIGGGMLEIGDYVGLASGARIITGSNQPEGLSMSAAAPKELQVVGRSYVHIHRYAFVGAGAIILPGVVLNEGACVGAGAVVTKDVPAWAIVVGSPARVIGQREVGRLR